MPFSKEFSDFLLPQVWQRPYNSREKCRWEVQTLKCLITDMSSRGLSPKTIDYAHMVLQKALKEAVIPFQLLTSNPARELKLPKQTKMEMKALSPQAAQAFLRECGNSEHGLLFEFALITGMRPEEYLALQWSDLELKKATATIQRVLVRNRQRETEEGETRDR
jgi:integrase